MILVNESDQVTGHMEKLEAHRRGVLHRAFSIFIFNRNGELLLQQRAFEKYHSGGLWTNTCCSHPSPGEETLFSAENRLREEMGFTAPLEKIFDFVYRAEFEDGLIEHEYDHVFVGQYEGEINTDPAEVEDHVYISIPQLAYELSANPGKYTAWLRLAFARVKEWWQHNYGKTELKK